MTVVSNVLQHMKFISMSALSKLNLYVWQQHEYYTYGTSSSRSSDDHHVALTAYDHDPSSSWIKKRLRVVNYNEFVQRRGILLNEAAEVGATTTGCAVCLNGVKGKHEIRELPNCSHVFHRECLDSWVDEDQHTCPLCRSSLLMPPPVLIPNCYN